MLILISDILKFYSLVLVLQIPKLKKHKPVPKTIYEPPKELSKLQDKKVENRRAAEGRLMSSSKSQFACADPNKSVKTERKLDEIRREEDRKLKFDSYRAKPLPKEVMVSCVAFAVSCVPVICRDHCFTVSFSFVLFLIWFDISVIVALFGSKLVANDDLGCNFI